MKLDSALADRQPDAGAARLTGSRFVDPIKGFEQMSQRLRRDSRAVISYFDRDEVWSLAGNVDLDWRIHGRVEDRVPHNVFNRAPQKIGVVHDDDWAVA